MEQEGNKHHFKLRSAMSHLLHKTRG